MSRGRHARRRTPGERAAIVVAASTPVLFGAAAIAAVVGPELELGAGGERIELAAIAPAIETSSSSTVVVTTSSSSTTTPAPPAAPANVRLRIERYGFDRELVATDDAEALAGHCAWHPSSAVPGARGRTVIAVPFDLGGIRPGDEIVAGPTTYRVVRIGREPAVDELFADVDGRELALYTSTAVTDHDNGRPFAVAREVNR